MAPESTAAPTALCLDRACKSVHAPQQGLLDARSAIDFLTNCREFARRTSSAARACNSRRWLPLSWPSPRSLQQPASAMAP